jgi:hypothetical protein
VDAVKFLCLFSSLFLILAYLRILFPTYGSKQLLSLFFKKGKTSCVGNHRAIDILSIFFVVFDHISRFLKSKLNPSQHVFIKPKPTVTNLSPFLGFLTLSVWSQGQTDCFNFSNAFDILPHALLHRRISYYGLSSGYVNWFLSYLTNRQYVYVILVYFLHFLSRGQACLKGQF